MQHTKTVFLVSLCCLLSACSLNPYSISFNNNVLFQPHGERATETFSDPALQACVNNFLINNQEESLETLSLLSCTDAGISSLQGLEQMTALTLLDLSNNEITDLGPVSNLENLRVLRVSNNSIRNIAVLNDLNLLNFIDLSGNNEISCRALDRLEERMGGSLIHPSSCF